MEFTLVKGASATCVLSSHQVSFLKSIDRSMPLFSNQESEACGGVHGMRDQMVPICTNHSLSFHNHFPFKTTSHGFFKYLARIFLHLKVDPIHCITDMKYLEAPTLSALSSKLNQVTESDMKLNCRIELYSCAVSLPVVTCRQNVHCAETTIEETASGLPKGCG